MIPQHMRKLLPSEAHVKHLAPFSWLVVKFIAVVNRVPCAWAPSIGPGRTGYILPTQEEDAADINFDDNFIYNELDVSISQRKLPTTQLLRDEAQMAFKQWRESTAKTEY